MTVSHSPEVLSKEANELHPLILYCVDLFDRGEMSDYDLVGVFILAYVAIRKRKSWCSGRMNLSLSSTLPPGSVQRRSYLLSCIPGLLGLLDFNYLKKKLQLCSDSDVNNVSIVSIFNHLQLSGIKKGGKYINECIVSWACSLRPCVLMFRIPRPIEVLVQQSRGERVVTLFRKKEELCRLHVAMLYYMSGSEMHAKDPLEFIVHDLKHMENFIDPSTYLEQVGFFRCVLHLSNDHHIEASDSSSCSGTPISTVVTNTTASSTDGSSTTTADTTNIKLTEAKSYRIGDVKDFFLKTCEFDEQLWRELEYVISDMNCYATHLMQYLLAKMIVATERLVERQLGSISILSSEEKRDRVREELLIRWEKLLLRFGMKRRFEPETYADTDTVLSIHGTEDFSGCSAASAYEAAMGMVHTSFRERGPMTADEGDVLRGFFRSQTVDVVRTDGQQIDGQQIECN